jgi:Carboxypeptidase regulatory-like domain
LPQAIRKFALFAALVCLPALGAQQNSAGTPSRDLSGTVTDPHHEPLRGAIVQLQVGDSPNISSYITGDDGRYRFLRLNGDLDYRVWVKFRDRTSHPRSLSKFDTNLHKVIDFTIESF